METETQKKALIIAIQGGEGSFHEMAARSYFGGTEIGTVPCETFEDLFFISSEGKSDCGLVAIENSVAGSILPNYTLLRKSGLIIAGEVYLRVVQNLMAIPGQTTEDLREIHSHPVAIQQCNDYLEYFRRRGVKIVETSDTALSAKKIREDNMKLAGALASSLAARLYNLEILAGGVEADKSNFTRFLLVARPETTSGVDFCSKEEVDKSSLCFSLPHKAGSLSRVLGILAGFEMNLTKVQSLPIVGRTWEYLFHIDLVFKDYQRYREALAAIRPLTEHLQILGEYRQGAMPGGED